MEQAPLEAKVETGQASTQVELKRKCVESHFEQEVESEQVSQLAEQD